MDDADLLEFLRAFSALLEKQKELINQMQTIIRNLSSKI